ncbi:MAG TPA: hypothetical protein ENN25_03925 [Euryarchaeota archaeon]|nr:hypothetical protein [Euryarchaeota archaeon]
MRPTDNFRERRSPAEDDIDYSKYFHEERIGIQYDDLPVEDPVRLREASNIRNEFAHDASEEPSVYFQCGMCDMLVGEDDSTCPFCGAEFSDDDEAFEVELDPVEERKDIVETDVMPEERRPEMPDEALRPEPDIGLAEQESTSSMEESVEELLNEQDDSQKVKVVEMALEGKSGNGGTSTKTSSFSKSASLLQRMEKIVDKAGEFGAETNDARRLLVAAWKACEEGNWNIVTSLAEETKKALVPNVTDMVRREVSTLREVLLDMKFKGANVNPQITKIKLIRKAMDNSQIDLAIELTKELIDETRDVRKSNAF